MAKISIDLTSGTIEKSPSVIGIDLGTTNSLIATVDSESGKAFCITKEGKSIVPSALHFGENISVGHEAIEKMIQEPENCIYSVKRLMGKSYQDIEANKDYFNYELIDEGEERLIKIRIQGKQYSPIELSALILKELKRVAEEKLQNEVKKVVITVPAYFNDSQRQATRDAGKLAGLDVLRIVNEPTAASLAYGIGLKADEARTVAVYDLGGGTFDVSILSIQHGIFEVLSTHGDTFLGGDDFDRAIVKEWILVHDFGQLSISERQLLRLTAEKAKVELSEKKHFRTDLTIGGSELTLSLSRDRYTELIKPAVDRTIEACSSALKDADLNTSAIDEVVLVGGSVRNPQVRKAVSSFFNQSSINDSINPDEVVAIGAAIEADILAGNRKDLLLLDVSPLSLGIETLGGLMDVILPRNSKVPQKVARQYTTSVDGQINLKINVYQGERELVRDNRCLGEFELRGIPAMPAGLPKIEVKFMLDADGILKVSAVELRSGIKQEVKLEPQYGLSDKEVEEMLKASIDHASEDMDQRSLVEAKTDAQQLIYSMNKFIEDNKHLMNEGEISKINELKDEIAKAIDAKDKDLIVNSCDALNEYSRQFAEKAMDETIAKALRGKKIQ